MMEFLKNYLIVKYGLLVVFLIFVGLAWIYHAISYDVSYGFTPEVIEVIEFS